MTYSWKGVTEKDPYADSHPPTPPTPTPTLPPPSHPPPPPQPSHPITTTCDIITRSRKAAQNRANFGYQKCIHPLSDS